MSDFIYRGIPCHRINASDWIITLPTGVKEQIYSLNIPQLYSYLDELLEYEFRGHLIVWGKVLK